MPDLLTIEIKRDEHDYYATRDTGHGTKGIEVAALLNPWVGVEREEKTESRFESQL